MISFTHPISDFLVYKENNIILGDLNGFLTFTDESFDIKAKILAHNTSVRNVIATSDATIVTTTSKGYISFFDPDFKVIKRFRCRNSAISNILSIDKNLFIFGDDLGVLYSMDIRKKDFLINYSSKFCQDYVSSIISLPSGYNTLITSGDGTIAHIDPIQMKTISIYKDLNDEITCAIKLNRNDEGICCCTEGGVVNFFTLDDWERPIRKAKTKSGIISCCNNNDGSLYFTNSKGELSSFINGKIETIGKLPNGLESRVKSFREDEFLVSQEETLFRFCSRESPDISLTNID